MKIFRKFNHVESIVDLIKQNARKEKGENKKGPISHGNENEYKLKFCV